MKRNLDPGRVATDREGIVSAKGRGGMNTFPKFIIFPQAEEGGLAIPPLGSEMR